MENFISELALFIIEKLYNGLKGKQDPQSSQIQWEREKYGVEINKIFEEGLIRVKINEYGVAKERFVEFLSYRRDSIDGYIALALVCSKLEKYKESINCFVEVSKLAQANGTEYKNEFKEIWFAHGIAHFKLKEYESAISCYQKSLRIDPFYANAKDEIKKCEWEILIASPPFRFSSSSSPSGLLGSSPFGVNSTPKLSVPNLSNTRSSSTQTPPREPERPPSGQGKKETTPLPVLRLGMQSNNVMRLQERLKELGFFKGEVDSIFGQQTLESVKRAQRSYNLKPDGIVGIATWNRLANS